MPRPRHVPSASQRERVQALATKGVAQHAIAREIGIGPNTLRRYYREQLVDRRKARLATVRNALISTRVRTEVADRTKRELVEIVVKLGEARSLMEGKRALLATYAVEDEHRGDVESDLMKLKARTRRLDAKRKVLAQRLRKSFLRTS